jgi:uncharacterized membrane protein
MIVLAIVVLAVGTYACKAAGPLFAAGRELSPTMESLTDLLPAALLAALVATQTLAIDSELVIDARVIGVGAAAVAVWLRAPFAIVVLIGAGVTAVTRMLGWG